jgi:hypothetical protein
MCLRVHDTHDVLIMKRNYHGDRAKSRGVPVLLASWRRALLTRREVCLGSEIVWLFDTSRMQEVGCVLCPLLADCVEKLENRGAPKISQMSRIGDFSRCKAL